MRICIAIDSFKGSISSRQAIMIAKDVFKDDIISGFVISDGGEGFIEAFEDRLSLIRKYVLIKGFNQEDMMTYYAFNKNRAFLEVAQPLGITRINQSKLNPYIATSYGLGQQILDALDNGCSHITIGLGGSATNDGGKGMMQALGVLFYDEDDNLLDDNCFNHHLITRIDDSFLDKRFKEASIIIASDVVNPLLGLNGATYVFGKQKGIIESDLAFYEAGLTNYSNIIDSHYNKSFSNQLGAGAAGGIGYSLYAFSNSTYISGLSLLVDVLGFEENLKQCDLLITGEGRIDKQSLDGKAVFCLASLAKLNKVPCLVVCGSKEDSLIDLKDLGIDLIFPIIDRITTLEEAMLNGCDYLKNAFIKINTIMNIKKEV